MMDAITLIGILLSVGALWLFPVILGLREARAKGRSPAWMWFGIHPIGAWIVYGVLHSLSPLKECPQCAEKVKAHAKICPYCMTPFNSESKVARRA